MSAIFINPIVFLAPIEAVNQTTTTTQFVGNRRVALAQAGSAKGLGLLSGQAARGFSQVAALGKEAQCFRQGLATWSVCGVVLRSVLTDRCLSRD